MFAVSCGRSAWRSARMEISPVHLARPRQNWGRKPGFPESVGAVFTGPPWTKAPHTSPVCAVAPMADVTSQMPSYLLLNLKVSRLRRRALFPDPWEPSGSLFPSCSIHLQ